VSTSLRDPRAGRSGRLLGDSLPGHRRGHPGGISATLHSILTTRTGTGLGRSISQRIIENHGGTIEVPFAAGAGSTFSVLLPVEADAYASYAEAKKGPRPYRVRPHPLTPPVVIPSPRPLRHRRRCLRAEMS